MNMIAIPPDALNRFRQAASQLTQAASSRASRLLTLKDDIAMLRKRGVSYRAISELLTQNGIPTSDVGVLKFCRRFLNESRKRKPAARRRTSRSTNQSVPAKATPADLFKTVLPTTPAAVRQTTPAPSEINPYRMHGPHIAKLEFRKPNNKT